eukprot:11857538-Karenia_brevis.AAC.1
MILEKIDTSKPTWLGLDPWLHNKDLCRKDRESERGSRGFGSTGVSEPIPGASRPAEAGKAASTPVNKFTDLPSMNVPTPKSKSSNTDKDRADFICSLSFDMIDYCQDALSHYRKCTGLKEFKRANTPFCPDGSLPAADEEVQGMLQ